MQLLNPNLDLNLPIMSSISVNHTHNHKILLKPTSTSTLFSVISPRSSCKFNRKGRIPILCYSLPSSNPRNCNESDSSVSKSNEFRIGVGKWVFNLVVGTVAVGSIFMDFDSPALAESLTVAFPVSRSVEVNRVQRTLIEAWGLIRETFVDPTFNHQDWDSKLQQTMVEMFPLRSADAAYTKISGMVSSLGDPFTRIISPKEYQNFRIGSDGNLQGVGLFVNAEPTSGHLVVVSCVDDSPASRAGIHEGDELLEINGERLDGMSSETVALKLRGKAGTTVKVKVHRGNDTPFSSNMREVNLPREYIKLSPISSAIIPHKTPEGHLSRTGYVKLSVFSQTAASDMEKVIHQLEDQDVHSYILDLRNNPGGLVTAGLDIAQLWLDGEETLVYTTDKDRHIFPINMVDGHAITHDPLVILVNEGSASASEILAGALHDNGRAILVGHKTFGKGKIQSVTELHDGSALFVTVAKYLSPLRHEIDKIGITPDVQCTADMLNAPKLSMVKDKNARSVLEADSCIMVAEHVLDIQQTQGTAS
ncbi:hypothetical protein SOVF_196290 [Spinacia oleracea]|nr:hypothetical protein SOVF_196290 [Spinacia oleracea]